MMRKIQKSGETVQGAAFRARYYRHVRALVPALSLILHSTTQRTSACRTANIHSGINEA